MRRDLIAALAAALLVMCSNARGPQRPLRDQGASAPTHRSGLGSVPQQRPIYLIPASAVPSLDLNQAAENLGKLIAIGRENDARFWLTAFGDQSPCVMTAKWQPALVRHAQTRRSGGAQAYAGSATVRLRYRRTPYLVNRSGVFTYARWIRVVVAVTC